MLARVGKERVRAIGVRAQSVFACNALLLMKLANAAIIYRKREGESARVAEKRRREREKGRHLRGAREVIYDGRCVCFKPVAYGSVECALFMAEKNGQSIKARAIEIRRSFMRARQWSTD